MVKIQKNAVLAVLLLLLYMICQMMERLSIIKEPIADDLADFKNLFDSSLISTNPLLDEVLSHIQRQNGKMMRPILVLLTAKLVGKVTLATLHATVALELLHTASLVHDDVVDESMQRRGQPSVNAVYKNKVAVLVGDYLLAACLNQAGKTENVSIIGIISALGQELSKGELLQLSNVGNLEFSEEIYFEVIRMKTAALFAACTEVAAVSAGVTIEKQKTARLFGEYVGICFQIRDDIFDYFESREIGKPSYNDMAEGKLTLPVIYALNSTNEEWAKKIALDVKGGVASHQEIARLVEFTKQHGGIEYAVQVMYGYQEKALSLLKKVSESDVRTSLINYLEYLVERKK